MMETDIWHKVNNRVKHILWLYFRFKLLHKAPYFGAIFFKCSWKKVSSLICTKPALVLPPKVLVKLISNIISELEFCFQTIPNVWPDKGIQVKELRRKEIVFLKLDFGADICLSIKVSKYQSLHQDYIFVVLVFFCFFGEKTNLKWRYFRSCRELFCSIVLLLQFFLNSCSHRTQKSLNQ